MYNIKIISDEQHSLKLLFPVQPFELFKSAVLHKEKSVVHPHAEHDGRRGLLKKSAVCSDGSS